MKIHIRIHRFPVVEFLLEERFSIIQEQPQFSVYINFLIRSVGEMMAQTSLLLFFLFVFVPKKPRDPSENSYCDVIPHTRKKVSPYAFNVTHAKCVRLWLYK